MTEEKNSGKVEYHLYLFRTNEVNMKLVEDKRFYRITAKYILLYERGLRTTNYNEIGESELHYLSLADKQWLLDCNMIIVAEETEKHKDEIAAHMGLMLDKLENALEEERAKETVDDSGTESE